MALSIQERIKDLRLDRGLTLEQFVCIDTPSLIRPNC